MKSIYAKTPCMILIRAYDHIYKTDWELKIRHNAMRIVHLANLAVCQTDWTDRIDPQLTINERRNDNE